MGHSLPADVIVIINHLLSHDVYDSQYHYYYSLIYIFIIAGIRLIYVCCCCVLKCASCSYFFQRSESDFQSYAKHSRWVLGDAGDGMGSTGPGGDPAAELESEFQALALESSAGPGQIIGPSSAKKLWALDPVSPEQGGQVVGQKQLTDEAAKAGAGGGIFVDQWRDPTWSGGYSQPTGPDGGHGQPPVLSPRLSEKMVEYVLGGSSPTALGLKKAVSGKDASGKKHGVGGQLANGTLTHDDYAAGGDESLDKKAAGAMGAPFDMTMATGPQPPLGFPDYAAHAAAVNGHNLMSGLDTPGGMLPEYSTPGAPNGPNSQQPLGYSHGGQRQQQQPSQGNFHLYI